MQTVKIGELEIQIEDHMSLKIEDGGKKIVVEAKAPTPTPYYPIWFYPNWIPAYPAWAHPYVTGGATTASQPGTMQFTTSANNVLSFTDGGAGTFSFSTN